MFMMPRELLIAVANYLGSKPYNEVVNLINELTKLQQFQTPQAETPEESAEHPTKETK